MLQVIKRFGFIISFRSLLNKFPPCCSKQQSVIQQLLSRKGRLIVMCSKRDASAVCPTGSCRVIEVPGVADCLQPVINIIPLQVFLSLFSYFSCLPFHYNCVDWTVVVFGSVACIPSDCSPWIRCGPTKESGEERDHTVGRGRGDGWRVSIPMLYRAGF
jgi:hypothetical protein